jgi:hypothetical protein
MADQLFAAAKSGESQTVIKIVDIEKVDVDSTDHVSFRRASLH